MFVIKLFIKLVVFTDSRLLGLLLQQSPFLCRYHCQVVKWARNKAMRSTKLSQAETRGRRDYTRPPV